MSALSWIIAVPWFVGGLLVWPVASLIRRISGERRRWFRKVFLVTLTVLAALGGIMGTAMLLGHFDHNWLPLTLLFPLINLVSVCWSLVGLFKRNEKNVS